MAYYETDTILIEGPVSATLYGIGVVVSFEFEEEYERSGLQDRLSKLSGGVAHIAIEHESVRVGLRKLALY